ncbi:MAG: hypothetical protein K2W95_35885 [Candidatus Obscuribacterales bacterium]|nr:hypothetical protein [Candidatus Obscuribacterales bacterium]
MEQGQARNETVSLSELSGTGQSGFLKAHASVTENQPALLPGAGAPATRSKPTKNPVEEEAAAKIAPTVEVRQGKVTHFIKTLFGTHPQCGKESLPPHGVLCPQISLPTNQRLRIWRSS